MSGTAARYQAREQNTGGLATRYGGKTVVEDVDAVCTRKRLLLEGQGARHLAEVDPLSEVVETLAGVPKHGQ